MFQGITVARNRPEERGRRPLPLDKTLLGVDWRFLAVADDEPGFLTAWLRPRSLERQVGRREEEYQNGVLAGFAREIGVDGVFATTHTHVSQGGIAHDRVSQGGIAQIRVSQGGIDQNRVGQGGNAHNRVSQGGIKTLEKDDDNDGGERDDIEHTERDSMASLDKLDGQSSHDARTELPQMAQTYSLDGRPRGRNSLVDALKKGGVHFPLTGEDTSSSEDTREWDGVDLASAPCLQSHVARNAADARRMSRHRSTCMEDGVGTTVDSTVCADPRGKKVAARRDAAPAPTRPSEPPAVMVFKPCLSVKLAENVPAELQTMIRVPEPRRSRVGLGQHLVEGSGVSQPQSEAGGQSLQDRAVEKLKIDLSLKQICPTCPQGARPSKLGGRRKRSAEASKEVPCKPRFRHVIPPDPTFRASSYGKAWYVDPGLWGAGISPEARKVDLGQQDQLAKGMKQQLTHAEAVKATIPTLFSATRFVSYIRQKGLRMPAHLERTERVMEETKMRASKARQLRNAGQDPAELVEHENNDDEPQHGTEWDNDDTNKANDETNQRMNWQSKLDAAMRLIRQRERRTLLGKQPTPPGGSGKTR